MIGDVAGERHLIVTTIIVMPSSASCRMTARTSPMSLGSSGVQRRSRDPVIRRAFFNRDHRFRREIPHQRALLVGEGPRLPVDALPL